jgi:hypothetical protein
MKIALWLLAVAALAQAVPPVRTIVKGAMSGIDSPRQVVVRTPAEWAALWKEHSGRDAPPAVDFSREMVVGVFSGRRNTGGYGVEIVRAVGNSSALIVEYVETVPGRDAITTQVLTAPFHLAAMPAHGGEVQFRKVEN